MGLTLHELRSNAVVLAKQFNPTIVSQLWLVENGIVSAAEFRPGCVFTELFCNVVADGFNLLVAPEQLQFTPSRTDVESESIAARVVGTFVNTLPHTPYVACGLNFTWLIETPPQESVAAFSRRMFFNPNCEVFRQFDVPEAMFGAAVSRPAFDGLLTMDCKPTPSDPVGVQCNFNLHVELDRADSRSTKRILELLENWNEVKNLSLSIMQAITGDLE